uniref:Uncharacterized protein n=1 Tax=Rhizophora mucronata TaxID=61149 RepID=A0A2P2QY09_RHIMU
MWSNWGAEMRRPRYLRLNLCLL